MKDFFCITLVIAYAIAIPAALTFWNVRNLVRRKMYRPILALILTSVIGLIDYFLLYQITFNTVGDYNEVIHFTELHYAIASRYELSFAMVIGLGFIGLLIIASVPAHKLSPLLSAIAAALVILGNLLGVIFAIHIFRAKDWVAMIFLYVFQLNMLILSITHIRRLLYAQVTLIKERKTAFRYRWMAKLYPLISDVSKLRLFYFIMIFPVAVILEILLILFGQGPDGLIKAFTMTADWNFSTQIPPPPIEYDGHYLCTVAAGGHRRIVKPLRFGMRRGGKIIVNRQLCIANAFEDLIKERMPRFHKWVRHFYDTHGYPLSRFITTPLKADIVYFLMKPLEWLFLIILYLFDVEPEKRIARQYALKEK